MVLNIINSSWIHSNNLRDFEQYKDELSKKNKRSAFLIAIRECEEAAVHEIQPANNESSHQM